MSEQSAKPYLVRAICEWCADNGYTPYLAVQVDDDTRVPAEFVKNGEIVLNISLDATRKLTIDNDLIQFPRASTACRGKCSVPMATVAGIFAKETGYGFAFTVTGDPIATLSGGDADAEPAGGKSKSRPTHLQVIK